MSRQQLYFIPLKLAVALTKTCGAMPALPPEASPGISSPSHECRHLSGTVTYRRSLVSSSPLALALPSTFLRFCRTRETFSVIHSYVGRSVVRPVGPIFSFNLLARPAIRGMSFVIPLSPSRSAVKSLFCLARVFPAIRYVDGYVLSGRVEVRQHLGDEERASCVWYAVRMCLGWE